MLIDAGHDEWFGTMECAGNFIDQKILCTKTCCDTGLWLLSLSEHGMASTHAQGSLICTTGYHQSSTKSELINICINVHAHSSH